MADYDVAIIGGGVSAFAAAMYSGRFQLKTAVIADKLGGTIVLTDDIANYPGFKKITGLELAGRIQEHAEEYGITIIEKLATRLEHRPDGEFVVWVGDEKVSARTIIYATGTEWKKLKVPGEAEYTGRGVHYCALCDGAFYKGKVIGVVGGSDSAAKEALLLADYGSKVYIIYRREQIHPEPINLKRVLANQRIEIINNTNVIEIRGEKFVDRAILDKPYKGASELMLDALFIDIGHTPLSSLAKDIGVQLNKKGEIIIDRQARTNVPGFFAAGDVVDTVFKQAITGVAEGVSAAYSAYQFITQEEVKP